MEQKFQVQDWEIVLCGLGRSEKWEQDLSERSIIYEKYPIFDLSIDKNGIVVL